MPVITFCVKPVHVFIISFIAGMATKLFLNLRNLSVTSGQPSSEQKLGELEPCSSSANTSCIAVDNDDVQTVFLIVRTWYGQRGFVGSSDGKQVCIYLSLSLCCRAVIVAQINLRNELRRLSVCFVVMTKLELRAPHGYLFGVNGAGFANG